MAKFRLDSLSQEQNEALLGLLIAMYRSDRKVSLEEQDLFDRVKLRLSWKSGVDIEAYCAQLTAEVRDGDTASLISGYLNKLSGHEEIAMLSKSMAESDGEISGAEEKLLQFINDSI